MRTSTIILLGILAISATAEDPVPLAVSLKVDIEALKSADAAVRDSAQKRLRAAGLAAFPVIRAALEKTTDAEAVMRLRQLIEPGKLYWELRLPTFTSGSPVVIGDRVLVATEDVLVCIDRLTGKILWQALGGGVSPKNVVMAGAGKIIVNTEHHGAMCLELEKGTKVWEAGTKTNSDADRIVAWDGRVGIPCDDNAFRVLDSATGKVLWERRQKQFLSPDIGAAYDQGKVVVTGTDGFICCLDAESGEEKWQAKLSAVTESPPVLVQNGVLVSTDGKLVALNLENGEVLWEKADDFRPRIMPVVLDEKVFIALRTDDIWCLSLRAGSQYWTVEQPECRSSFSLGNDRLYSSGYGHQLTCMDLSGNLIWKFESDTRLRDGPALSDELVIAADKFKVYALTTGSPGPANWGCYGGSPARNAVWKKPVN
jgi:outer membrane protein assembly factor BamB